LTSRAGTKIIYFVHLTRSRILRARRSILGKLEIYEPPLCCPTGVCGPAPDPALANLQENILRWKEEGIDVERLAINQVPQRFMTNPTVVELLTREGQEVLPIALLDGKVICKGKYPTYDQVARGRI
jgi:hypothetical protein